MTNKKNYKAYISYSHRDEKWAIWLHRALESYRVPKKLVGSKTAVGKVPSRLRPVFRDRDDLSSAACLSTTVEQALQDSENMIVVCSPDAVASKWVNEEIRRFARSGKSGRIFCVIVNGDPSATDAENACFPTALAEVGLREPLAADVRKWADGKHLSKLKLVAGILGLPLDQLRQRDLQKRQKVWAMTAIASIVALAVLFTAITARIAAQQRRDSGESLVAYKLKELRTMLNVTDDPEQLVRLADWDEAALERLTAEAGNSEAGLMELALQKRERGTELWKQGNLSAAMTEYQQSWALIAVSYQRDRRNHQAFFELGQAEFYIGQTHMDQGELEAAEVAFMSYAEITRRLITLEPKNAEWVLEMAYALTNLGLLNKAREMNTPERTLQFMQSSLEYNQIALVLDPANDYYQSELGQSHAHLADAQLDVCDVDGALKSRQEQVELDSALLNAKPGDNYRSHRTALAYTGLATMKEFAGDLDGSIADLKKAVTLLEDRSSENTGDLEAKIVTLHRKVNLTRLYLDKGDIETARALFEQLSAEWRSIEGISSEDMRSSMVYIEHLLHQARLSYLAGEVEMPGQLLRDIQVHLVASMANGAYRRAAGNLLVQAAFQRWESEHVLPAEDILASFPQYDFGQGRARACADARSAVLKAVMLEQTGEATRFSDYLLEKGFKQPGFMRVCRQYSLCVGQ